MKTRKVEQLYYELASHNSAKLDGWRLAEILELSGLVEIIERDTNRRPVRYAETPKFWNSTAKERDALIKDAFWKVCTMPINTKGTI